MTSLAQCLDYKPPSLRWTKPRADQATNDHLMTRWNNDFNVERWDGFSDQARNYIHQLLSDFPNATAKFPYSMDDDELKLLCKVYSEAGIYSVIQRFIDDPLRSLSKAIANRYCKVATSTTAEYALNPDFFVCDCRGEDLENEILLAVVEVKTPWSFPSVPNGDLVAAFQAERNSFDTSTKDRSPESKVGRAITQIWAYMTVNQLKYGVLTTYQDTYFLCRQPHEADKPSRLLISPAITVTSTDPSIMHVWLYFLSLTRQQHLYSSPYSTPPLSRKMNLLDRKRVYTRMNIPLWQLRFRQSIGGARTALQVDIGADNWVYVKMFDTINDEKALIKYETEVEAYRRLKSLQGSVIPRFLGCALVSDFILAIFLEDCGHPIDESDIDPHRDQIKTALSSIHQQGVLHKDIACRNLVVRSTGSICIIDFDNALFRHGGRVLRKHELIRDCFVQDLTEWEASVAHEINNANRLH